MTTGVELAAVGVELIPGIAGSDNLTVGTSTITGGVSGRFLYDNAGILGEYLGSAPSAATSIALRDGNQNTFANNFSSKAASVVSAGATTVLTAASARIQTLTGTSAQTFQLPDATTLTAAGFTFQFNNDSTQPLTVTNNGGATVATVPAGGAAFVTCLSIATANGSWGTRFLIPSAVTWGSSLRLMNTTAVVAGGAAAFLAFSTAGLGVFMGSGAPTVSAAKGSLYLRTDGSGVNDRAYINTDGGTTWTPLVTVA